MWENPNFQTQNPRICDTNFLACCSHLSSSDFIGKLEVGDQRLIWEHFCGESALSPRSPVNSWN